MKLAPMIMFLVIIQITIMFFNSAYSAETYTLDPYNSTTIINNTDNKIFKFILDPTGWSATSILTLLFAVIGVTGAAILIGTFLTNRTDTAIFYPVAFAFFGFGAIPIVSLYNAFMTDVTLFGCTIDTICTNAILLYGLTVGFISIFYILAVLEWWSGRSTS